MQSTDALVLLVDPMRRFRAWISHKPRSDAREILGSLCESPSERVVPNSADEVWVTRDLEEIRIGDMAPEHCAHALALIMRNLRLGKVAQVNRRTNQIMFFNREERKQQWRDSYLQRC